MYEGVTVFVSHYVIQWMTDEMSKYYEQINE